MAPAVREALAALHRARTGSDDTAAKQWLARVHRMEGSPSRMAWKVRR